MFCVHQGWSREPSAPQHRSQQTEQPQPHLNMYGQQILSDTLCMLNNAESLPSSEHVCMIAGAVIMYTKAFGRKLISSRQPSTFVCMSKQKAEENEMDASLRGEH